MNSTATTPDRVNGDDFARSLDRAGYRITGARRAVLDLILSRQGAFDTSDLIADARRLRLGVSRATIFRTLEILSKMKAVERLDRPDGEHSYIRCDAGHHHHVVCTRCGRSVDFGECGMQQVAAEVTRRTGFQVERHRVELFGLCPCYQSPASA